jgi:hypothetical protein
MRRMRTIPCFLPLAMTLARMTICDTQTLASGDPVQMLCLRDYVADPSRSQTDTHEP